MKINTTDFLDWLHKERKAAEAKRKRRGQTGADYLRNCAAESKRIRERLAERRHPTARDREPDAD